MVCATDNIGRVAMPNPYRTVFMSEDLSTLSLGNVVLAKGGGYWATVSDQGVIHLLHFTDGEADEDIEIGSSDFSHLSTLGPDHMVAAWESESGITGLVLDSESGAAVSSEFPIDVPDNRYQAFKPFPDGSAAYPAPGTSSTAIRVARVLPCD
jgi:hypothetical protein